MKLQDFIDLTNYESYIKVLNHVNRTEIYFGFAENCTINGEIKLISASFNEIVIDIIQD